LTETSVSPFFISGRNKKYHSGCCATIASAAAGAYPGRGKDAGENVTLVNLYLCSKPGPHASEELAEVAFGTAA
jgi:hypothetical protein